MIEVKPRVRTAQPIDVASREIAQQVGVHRRRRFFRTRVALPIAVIDAMFEDLEQLNLQERHRVPREWDARLARLTASLPVEVREIPPLRSNISPTRLMDMLFELQDRLFDLKIGAIRAELAGFDQPLEVA